MNYIPADKLIAEIEKRISIKENLIQRPEMSDMKESLQDIIVAYQSLKSFITSLQQEQLEVDLEKEIEKEWERCNPIDEGMGVESAYIHIEAFDIIARHFYELGRTSNK